MDAFADDASSQTIPVGDVPDGWRVLDIGPIDKIRDDLAQWDASVVNTLVVSGSPPLLEQIAGAVG